MKLPVILALCAIAAPLARPADNDSIESTVKAVYEAISGPAGPRDWARFRSLFAAGTRLIPMRTTPTGSAPSVMSPDDYVQRSSPNREKTAFFENAVAQRIEMFGNMAHVFSTYESRRAPGEKPFARGINSFQLVRQGGVWKVMTILWDASARATPFPRNTCSRVDVHVCDPISRSDQASDRSIISTTAG